MKKIKRVGIILLTLLLLFLVSAMPVQSDISPPTGFNSFFYTPKGAILISYNSDTFFVVKDSSDIISWNGTLDKGTSKQLSLEAGIYSVSASKPYTLIVGDPQIERVVGYFAIDANGRGTSKDLYSYIPRPDPLYAGNKFIVFSYEEDTNVRVTDVNDDVILWQGVLNESQHFSQDLKNSTWQNITVHIESNKPVSALCYLDQGFIVPSSTGLFTGNLFYTFASNITNGNNDLNVIGYHDDTEITITNTITQALIWNGTLHAGEVHSEVFSDPIYLTVESNQSIAVTVDPYQTWPMMYQAALYVGDVEGILAGKNFFTTARGGGYLRVIAYQNDTHVTIIDQKTKALVWDGMLDSMESHATSTSNTVYNVTSDKFVSVMEGYGGWSAMFAPLYYTTDTQPPTIGTPVNVPQNPIAAQNVQVTADVIDDVSGVQMVILSYGYTTLLYNTTMTWSGENTYTANVTTRASQIQLIYKLIAYDNVNNTATSSQITLIVTPEPSPAPSPSPSPEPIPSPSPSPTASPNPTPSPSPSPSPPPSKPFWTESSSVQLIIAVVVPAVLTVLGLGFYLKKRKKK
ncbi:hypothetical protein E2P61_00010 [Candidatus Bathyarchaeota archaeon]|nr:hypothetical protein E2P61_00010 [Candidatus Bathyarchaeota archaeon]